MRLLLWFRNADWNTTGPLGARRRRLVRSEIELDFSTAGIVAEDLPDARAHLLAQRVLDAVRLEPRHRPFEVARGEGEMVEHPCRVGGQLGLRDVQDRLAARVHPGAAEAQGRPRALCEAEHAGVEGARLLELVREHVEMIHSVDCHSPPQAKSPDWTRFTPAFSIFTQAAASEPCMSIARH